MIRLKGWLCSAQRAHPARMRARHRDLLLLAAILLVGAPEVAGAAPFVDVKYDLSDSTAISTIPFLNVTTEIPPHGTVSGYQTIRYVSDSVSGLATGPAELLTFNLYVQAAIGSMGYTPNGGVGFITLNTSDLRFEFLGLAGGSGAGQRLPSGTITPLGDLGVFRVTGYIHCYRFCSQLKLNATTTATLKPTVFTAPLPRLTGAVGQSHVVRGTATGIGFFVDHYDVGLGSYAPIYVSGSTSIVGREIQRTPVPEPAVLPLVATGIAGIALGRAAFRRRLLP